MSKEKEKEFWCEDNYRYETIMVHSIHLVLDRIRETYVKTEKHKKE